MPRGAGRRPRRLINLYNSGPRNDSPSPVGEHPYLIRKLFDFRRPRSERCGRVFHLPAPTLTNNIIRVERTSRQAPTRLFGCVALAAKPPADNPPTSNNFYPPPPYAYPPVFSNRNQARAAHRPSSTPFFAFSAPRPGFAGPHPRRLRTNVFRHRGRVAALCADPPRHSQVRPPSPWNLGSGKSGLCMTAASGPAAVSVPPQGTRGL